MKHIILRGSLIAIFLLLVVAAFPAFAIEGSFTGVEYWGVEGDPICENASIVYFFDFTAINSDVLFLGDYYDTMGFLILNGEGTPIQTLWTSREVGVSDTFYTGYSAYPDHIRPITVKAVDLNGTPIYNTFEELTAIFNAAPVLDQITFDPADYYADCAKLPLASTSTCLDVPAGSVVGDLPLATRAYYRPGDLSTVTLNPGTYWVLGTDESGEYYKIILACEYLWVPVNAMQPSYQAPQNGAPLPTRVVS